MVDNSNNKTQSIKKVYVGMGADLLHPGHLNIIATAAKYGEVIIGLLTDSAVVKFSRLPYMTYEQRKIIMQSVFSTEVVQEQDSIENFCDKIASGKANYQKLYNRILY